MVEHTTASVVGTPRRSRLPSGLHHKNTLFCFSLTLFFSSPASLLTSAAASAHRVQSFFFALLRPLILLLVFYLNYLSFLSSRAVFPLSWQLLKPPPWPVTWATLTPTGTVRYGLSPSIRWKACLFIVEVVLVLTASLLSDSDSVFVPPPMSSKWTLHRLTWALSLNR